MRGDVVWDANKYHRETYHYFKQKGICVYCHSELAMIGASYCDDCAGKRLKRQTAYIGKIKSCTIAHSEYKEKANEYRRNRIKMWREAGLCTTCGKRPPRENRKMCLDCSLKHNRRMRKKDIERNARPSLGLCFICGLPVVESKKVCAKHYKHIQNMRNAREELK